MRYQSDPAEVAVTAGENSGKTVRYHNVARELDRLGAWTGRARVYEEPPASEGGLKSAVLVQAKGGGPILAVLAPSAAHRPQGSSKPKKESPLTRA